MKTYRQWPRSGLSGSLLGCIAAVALSATPLFATIPNDFHQGANNDNNAQPLGYTTWENGGINGQKAILAEGMLLPQRVILYDSIPVTANNIHVIDWTMDSMKGGKHAFDFIDGWDNTVEVDSALLTAFTGNSVTVAMNGDGDAISATGKTRWDAAVNTVVVVPSNIVLSNGVAITDPAQDKITAYVAKWGARGVRVRSNVAFDGSFTPTLVGVYSGDTSAQVIHWTLTVKTVSAPASIGIEFAGHIAVGNATVLAPGGWGLGLGGASISGSSYHVSMVNCDGVGIGSQDNQMQGGTVINPPLELVCGSNSSTCTAGPATNCVEIAAGSGTAPFSYEWRVLNTSTVIGTEPCVVVNPSVDTQYEVTVTDGLDHVKKCTNTVSVTGIPLCSITLLTPPVTSGGNESWTGPDAPAGKTYTYGWSYYYDNNVGSPTTASGQVLNINPISGTAAKIAVTLTVSNGVCTSTCSITNAIIQGCSLVGPDVTCPGVTQTFTNTVPQPAGITQLWWVTPTDGCAAISGSATGTSVNIVAANASVCNCDFVVHLRLISDSGFEDCSTAPGKFLTPPPEISKGSIGECYADAATAKAAAIAATTATAHCAATLLPLSATASGTCSATITVSATDSCGNTVSVNYSTRIDNTPPVLTGVPGNTQVECLSDVADPAVVTATDNCDAGFLQVFYHAITNGTACDKTITRTWTATDTCGRTASLSQDIEVKDDLAPIVEKTGGIEGCYADTASAIAAARLKVTATDNCGGSVTTNAWVTGTCSAVVHVTATDSCGNTSQEVTFNTRIDNENPVLLGVPDDTQATCNTIPAPANVTATDNCDGTLPVSYGAVTNAGTSCSFTITRTWTATDTCGHTTTDSQTITVVDTVAPVLTKCGTIDTCYHTVEAAKIAALAVSCATDACGTVVGYGATVSGTCSATVSVVATDSCGNTSDPVVFNTRIDDTKPVISGVPADVTVSCGEEPAAPTVTATDTCSGTLTVYLKETRENINGCTNTLTRCWTATDSCGNTDTKCQVITIADLNPPVLTNPDGVSACTGSTVSVNPPTATDDCDGNVEINVSDNGTWKTKSTDGGATYTPSWASVVSAIVAAGGSHTIHVVASDNCGHEASGDFSISLAACDEHCTLTQGFYGNQKGKFNGVSGFTVVNTLLTAPYGGDLIVGAGGATLKITSGQGGCIAMWLPAGGPSVAMPPGAHVFGSGCSTDLPTQKNGKAFRNNLLGQVITLALNLRLDVYAGNTPGLGSWPLPAEFCTGNGEVVTGHYTIPASILAALPANPTVQDLLNLANAVLGGVNTTIDPSAIGGAVTTINEAFDECKFTMPCILD